MPEPFTHVLRVRYGECDPQGVVFNANYFTYFDVALTELWRESLGPYTDMMAAGVDMVVAEASARYHAPAGFDEELAVAVSVTHLGTTSMVTRLEVLRAGGRAAARAGMASTGAGQESSGAGKNSAGAAQEAPGDGKEPPGVERPGRTQLVVEGSMRHVFIDSRTKRKTEIPPEIRRGLERHLVAETWSTSA